MAAACCGAAGSVVPRYPERRIAHNRARQRKSPMPTYQYYCTECAHELEQVQKFTDDSLTVCPSCAGLLRKRFSAVGVVFKGSGFYTTDSRAEDARKNGAQSTNGDTSTGNNSSGSDGASSTSSEQASSDNSGSSDTSGSSTTGSSTSGSSSGSGANASGSGDKAPAGANAASS